MRLIDTIEISNDAAKNIKRLKSEYGANHDHFLRFGLSGGGCSGYKYILEFEDAKKDDDLIFTSKGVKILVNSEHMIKLKNSIIDWEESLMESGFKIVNPQAKQPCGCGESINF